MTVRKKDKDISQLKDLIRAEAQKTEVKMKDLENQLFEANQSTRKYLVSIIRIAM